MSRYKELQEKIAALKKEAEEARKQEVSQVIAEIKAKMAEYMISVEDLRPGTKRARKARGQAKYADPVTGKTWTGKGRMPEWLKQAIAQGKSLDSFAV